MYLAGKIFYNSICNSIPEVLDSFATSINQEIKNWRQLTKQSVLPRDLRNKTSDDILSALSYPECSFYYGYCLSNLKDEQRFPF